MPEFVNPFSGRVPDRKMTREELIRAIRMDLAAEHEAVHEYTAHAGATDDPLAKTVLLDIANEERVHAGEFARLIAILTGDEDQYLAKGAVEVDEVAKGLAAATPGCGGSGRGGAWRGEAGALAPPPGLASGTPAQSKGQAAGASAQSSGEGTPALSHGLASGTPAQSSGEGTPPEPGEATTIGSLRI